MAHYIGPWSHAPATPGSDYGGRKRCSRLIHGKPHVLKYYKLCEHKIGISMVRNLSASNIQLILHYKSRGLISVGDILVILIYFYIAVGLECDSMLPSSE